MDAEDETAITEITIQPDGRIFVFGLSLEVARALEDFARRATRSAGWCATFEKPPKLSSRSG